MPDDFQALPPADQPLPPAVSASDLRFHEVDVKKKVAFRRRGWLLLPLLAVAGYATESLQRPAIDKLPSEPTFVNDSTVTDGGLSISVVSTHKQNDTLAVSYTLEWTMPRPGEIPSMFMRPWTQLTIEYFDVNDMPLEHHHKMIFLSEHFASSESRCDQVNVAFPLPTGATSFAIGFDGMRMFTKRVRIPQ